MIFLVTRRDNNIFEREYHNMDSNKARVIALYLPQFHPIPENDKYWGKGFTEWTNVAKAKPLFRGHDQPRIPADLGFYDLRLPEISEAQAELAKEAGIEGFCYWHYWFGNGKQVLEMPFDRAVNSGKPDFPFCLGWANHDWTTKTWEKGKGVSKDTMIFKQEYPGDDDYQEHFYRFLKAFKDERYIRVDGKLLFLVFNPFDLPNAKHFTELWNKLAADNGLNGFHFVATNAAPSINNKNMFASFEQAFQDKIDGTRAMGFDAIMTTNQKYAELKTAGKLRKIIHAAVRRVAPGLLIEKYPYKKIIDNLYTEIDARKDVYPQLLAGWDRSPRSGRKAIIYYGTTPETFEYAVDKVLNTVKNKEPEHRIVFLNSWNEWGEGAYMEPDLKYGKGKIGVLKKKLVK